MMEKKKRENSPYMAGNCNDRQSGLEDAQTGQEEGDNREGSTKLGRDCEFIHSKHSQTVLVEAAIQPTRLTVRTHPPNHQNNDCYGREGRGRYHLLFDY